MSIKNLSRTLAIAAVFLTPTFAFAQATTASNTSASGWSWSAHVEQLKLNSTAAKKNYLDESAVGALVSDEPEQLRHRLLVSGWKIVIEEVARGDPA